jgi:hypothetical protein
MKAKTLILAALLGTAVAAPTVYAADQYRGSQATGSAAQAPSDNSPRAWDQRRLSENNQPGGTGG